MISFGRTLPISIYPTFWLMAAAIGWLNSLTLAGTLLWISVIFVSVLIHELGHASTAMLFGQRAEIDLVALGGLTKRSGGGKVSLFKEFLIVFNGPLAGLCLFVLAYLAWQIITVKPPMLAYWLKAAMWVNLFWTLINLLPIQPLDGGKLLSIVFEALFGFRGVKIALFLSLFLAGTFAFACLAVGLILPGVLFLIFAYEGYRTWRMTLPMTVTDSDEHLQSELQAAERDLEEGRIDQSIQELQSIREQAKSGVIFVAATELLANALAMRENFQEAHDLIMGIGKNLSPQGLVLQHLLSYRLGKWREAADLGDRVFEIQPTKDVALLNARSHARLGELEPTIGWIRCAIREGLIRVQEALQHPDFDQLRDQPAFAEWLSR